jgi:hypothetical protein
MMFPLLIEVYGDGSDVNADAVTNIRFRCRLSSADVVDVVSATLTNVFTDVLYIRRT